MKRFVAGNSVFDELRREPTSLQDFTKENEEVQEVPVAFSLLVGFCLKYRSPSVCLSGIVIPRSMLVLVTVPAGLALAEDEAAIDWLELTLCGEKFDQAFGGQIAR